jgi:hypothetical protein
MRVAVILVSLLLWIPAFGQTKVAIAKIVKGEVDLLTMGKTTKLKAEDWVESGSVIRTGEKSFVRLVFVDKSTMNITSGAEMKIESFNGKEAGVIDLVKGSIRSQVTKDYLQIKNKDKSKLFIKTQNAVMGVRGTEFDIATNGVNTTTILYEGEIVFNSLKEQGTLSPERLEQIVDSGVRVYPGDFSVMEAGRSMPTVPARLNVLQLEALQKSKEFDGGDSSASSISSQEGSSGKSVVPEGLTGAVVSNDAKTLKAEVTQVTGAETLREVRSTPSTLNPEGYVKGDEVKPANGSFVHLQTGVIIPPDSKAVLDPVTSTYIPSPGSGSVASNGSYVPPKNVEITDNGKILVAVKDNTGAIVVKEIPPPPPVVSANTPTLSSLGAVVTGPTPAGGFSTGSRSDKGPGANGQNGKERSGPVRDIPLPVPGSFDPRFTPNGGIFNVNDPTRQNTLIDTTIILNPN